MFKVLLLFPTLSISIEFSPSPFFFKIFFCFNGTRERGRERDINLFSTYAFIGFLYVL